MTSREIGDGGLRTLSPYLALPVPLPVKSGRVVSWIKGRRQERVAHVSPPRFIHMFIRLFSALWNSFNLSLVSLWRQGSAYHMLLRDGPVTQRDDDTGRVVTFRPGVEVERLDIAA